ncbi:ABC transporter permease [Micromonosporaceae bacterium DT55]|uniref:ABC transporter permease n=1 Tax=Melissospora conviva TaxID=3388432 RepID=UPI003C225AC8
MTGEPEERSRLRAVDLVNECLAGILQRPGRTVMTLFGIVLGLAAFVAILGITASAQGQISKSFTELSATEVRVEDLTVTEPDFAGTAFPADAEERVLAIDGVRHAGVYWAVPANRVGAVTAVELPGGPSQSAIPVLAASPGLLSAVRGELGQGRALDAALDRRAERVALLGGVAARQLGITRLDNRPVVIVGGMPLTVVGIVDQVERSPELLAAVWVPRGTVEKLWPVAVDPGQPPQMIIDTELGAAEMVARQAPLALRPDAAERLRASAPPDPSALREKVDTDLSALFLALAGLSLLVGAVGIANTTLVAVLERVPEIGLRRALGAQRRHIVAQFLTESTLLGLIGGLVATGAGAATVVGVALTQQWSPILAPWTVLVAPLIGGLTGLLAGLYPSVRAGRIEPVVALRG